MVFARKYRPKCLEDVIGQPVVVKTITNALVKNRLHHAYLFGGNLGSGKTTTARVLAASENCKVSPGLKPCGQCSVCVGIFEGSHVDVLEIDAASNAGKVEQIRELKNSASYRPVDGAKSKYFIIDEFHRCGLSSSEALLKLIEEPPPSVRFVLCTTEINNIRPTILSRCQSHEFKKIYWREISEYLHKVTKLENIETDLDSLHLCSKLSGGSVRNALQNLQKVVDFCDNKITIDDTQKALGAVSDVVFYDLLDQVIGNGNSPDATKGYRIINELLSLGIGFDVIYGSIADSLRNILIGITASSCVDLIMVSDEGKKRLIDQLKKCKTKINCVVEVIKNLVEMKTSVEYGLSPELALQTWLIGSIFIFNK